MNIFSRFLVFVLVVFATTAFGQVYQYSGNNGNLVVQVLGSNPCLNGATFQGGYIEFRVLSTANGQPARLNTVVKGGGGGPNYFSPTLIAVGSSFIFYNNNSGVPGGSSFTPNLPIGAYDFYIEDNSGAEFISTFSSGNPVRLVQLSDISINEVLLQDNSDCDFPLDGRVVASISGGSLDLVGGTPPPPEQQGPESSFTYTWTSDNSLAGLPLTNTWDGTTDLDLASLLGATGLPGGTYTLAIEDNYSVCSETRSFTITDPTPAIQNVLGPFAKSVCIGSDITVQLDNTELGVDYQILRNGSVPALYTFPGTGPGVFSMTFPSTGFATGDVIVVRAVDGFCSPTTMNNVVTITIRPLPTAVSSGGGASCIGSPLPNVTFSFTGTAPFTFTYTDGTTPVTVTNHPTSTYTIVGATAGSYQVTNLVDANGCIGTNLGSATNVIVNPLPTASITGGGPVCAGSPLPNVTFNFTGTAPYTFTYTDGTTPVTVTNHPSGTFTITNAAAGTYSISSLTDANSCVATDFGTPVSVIINPLPTAVVSGGGTICAGGTLPDVTFTFTGTAPFTFTYTDGTTPVTITNHPTTTFTIVGAAQGVYSVSALTDANICAATNLGGTAAVIVNPLPTAVINGGGPVCTGSPLPNVTFTFTGTAPFTFTYTDGTSPVTINNHPSTTFTITNAAAGTYSISSLTDGNTCVGTDLGAPVAVIINPLPTASVSGGGTICTGATLPDVTFTFTGTAPYTFNYTDGVTVFTVTNHPSSTYVVSGASAGLYSVTSLVDGNSCSASNLGGSVSVIVNPLPTATISGGGPVCFGSPLPNVNFTFTGTAPFTFTYSDGTTPVTITNHPSSTYTITNAPAGTYSISSLTDANTCIATTIGSPVIVSINALPTAVITGGGSICSGGTLPDVTITLTGAAPFTFTYTDGATPVTITNHPSATYVISNAAAGTYQVTSLTDGNSCAATSLGSSVAVVVNPLPTASIAGGGTVCSGSPLPNVTFTFTGTAPFTFTYTDGTTPVTVTNHPSSSFTVTNAPAGTYSISSLSDANTCVATSLGVPATVTVNPLPTANIDGTATICEGNSTNLIFTLPAPGNFDVIFTDGTINFNANGITNGATFSVSPTSNTTYTIVSVTAGGSGCTVTAPSPNITGSAVITVNPVPVASISGSTTLCNGSNATLTFTLPAAGTYDVVYTDGTTNFTANGISNGATVSVSPTSTTTYTIVSVTNIATSCVSTAPTGNITGSAVITVNPSPVASISGTATICVGQNTNLTFTLPTPGTFDVVYTDGTTNFNANGISNGATVSVSPTANITYTIISVTNTATSCTVTAPSTDITGSAVITVTPLPTADISGTATICEGNSTNLVFTLPAPGNFDVVFTDGTINFTTNGITNGATFSVSPTANTTYTIVSVTTAGSGCTVTAPSPNITGSAVITVNTSPTASISGTAVICQGDNATLTFNLPATGTFDVVYTDGTTNFNANGILNGATVSVSPAANTTYTIVSVTNTTTSCVSTAPSGNITGSADITVSPAPTASISGTATICLGNSTTLTFTLPVGTYDVVYTDGTTNFTANGIVTGATVSVSPTADISYTIVSVTNTITSCSVTAPSASITGSADITVIPTPTGSIAGTATICAGDAATLTFTLPAGTYDVVFTDGTTSFSATGIVTGATVSVSPTANTTYTITSITNTATSCTVTAPNPGITGSAVITVTPAPTATISGTTSICSGSSTNITVTFTGTGPWSFQYSDGTTTSPVIPSFFNSITIPVSPTATTTYTLILAGDATVCPAVIGGSAVVTVNQNPLAGLTVGKTIDPLCSGGISDVTVATSELGVSYQLRNDAGNIDIGTPVIGTGGTISLPTGVLTATTTFNVLATSAGCTPVELTTLVTVNVTGAINAGLAVASDTNPVCSGSGANIVVSASENGVLYQLRNDADNSAVGAAVPGTGGAISLPTGNLTATTTYNVFATNGTCSIELTDSETVTVGTAADATLAVAVTIDPLCSGGITDITVALTQLGVTYQLRNDADDSNVGPAVAGTGGTIALPSGVLTTNTTFNVLATAPGCSAIELTTLASVTVSGAVDATLAVTSAASPICEGTGTDIIVAASEAGVTYQLRDDATNTPIGAAVAGTGGSINLPTGNLTASTTFNVLASNGTCSIELTDTETVNVDVAPDASLAVNTTLNPLCVGGTSAVTIALSQTGVSYQLRDDADDSLIGSAVTGNGGTISLPTGVLNATTVFNILATSGVCASVELTNTATVTVAGTLDASLTVSSSAATICSGTSTFVIVQASESGVQYQLRNDLDDSAIGAPVAGTGGNLNIPTGNLSTTTTFNVVANNGACSIELADTETITVTPSPTLSLSVAPASPLICPGNGTNIVVSGTESGVSYQLRNNADNSPVGPAVVSTGGNILFPTGNLTATTTFNVFAGSGTCAAQLTNTATVNVRLAGDPTCGGGPSDCANFSSIQPLIVTQPSCNDRDAGEVSFSISRADGTPTTFRVLWTINGNTQTKFTSSTTTFDDLSSGLYQYTIIDEGNGRSCGPVDFFLDLKTQVEIQSKQVTSNVTCFGGSDGNVILTVDGSTTGQYWYTYVLDGNESTAQTFTPGAPLPGGLPADDTDFIILKVDDNFNFTCPDTVMVRIRHTFAKIDFGVAATNVTTCNGTDGGIQVTTIAGGDSGTDPLQVRLKKAVSFSVDPSGYVVVVDFENVAAGARAYTGLSQGNYVVDVRDHLDCIQSKPIAVQAPGQVPLSSVTVTSADASCTNGGESGTIKVVISDAGIYEVAISQDQVNVPADADFIDYTSPSIPNVTFNNLASGAYYVYIKSSTTTCPTRTDAIFINGVQALADFDVLPNCGNVNLTLNNITGQQDASFVIRVFDNNDKFFKIDSLSSPNIPLSNSVTFTYAAPLQHVFLATPGTYRFVMIQNQTTGSGTCTLVSDTVVYQVRELLGITLGTVTPSFPEPKHTGAIEIANITGGTRFVTDANELYYEISLTTADDDIVIIDWEQVKLDPQNRFIKLYEFLPPGVYRVKVRDAAGCVKTIDVEIPLDGSIYIPNIFTPNADNINDEFEILNLPVSGTSQLIITNRWGNEVFKSSDYREGNFWTAEETSDGIYFYRLKVDGGQVFTGWVEILRGSKP